MDAGAPLLPHYDDAGLTVVLPSVAASLGLPRMPGRPVRALAPAARAVVVLVDGMGYELLRARGGHAPFLRSLLPGALRLSSGFPSTTPTAMGSFGTGLAPGQHGLLGLEVLIPGQDRLLNELSWEDGPDPQIWQPAETVFESAARGGVEVTRVGPGYFDGSGLTRAAVRGGRFVAAKALPERVDATLTAVRRAPRALAYLYWGELDKIGHTHGCESWEWGQELGTIDDQLRRLVESVPTDTAVHIIADHGMVEVSETDEIWNKRVSTAKLNQWLDKMLQRHSPPAVAGRRVNVKYMTQVKTRPPTFMLSTSRPEALGTSYTRYLINGLRESFGLDGVPIRLGLRKPDNPYAGKRKRPS